MDREAATPVTNMPKCFGNACAFHDHDMRSRFDKVDKCNRQKDGHIGHNSLLLGAPESTINKLQRAQKNAARVVLAANRRSDAKPLLRQLHWLESDRNSVSVSATAPKLTLLVVSAWFRLRPK